MRGITQATLAEKTNISLGQLRNYEQGKSWPTADNLASLAEKLKVQPYQFYVDPMQAGDPSGMPGSADSMQVADSLRRIRAGRSIAELAKKASVAEHHWDWYETGITIPSYSVVKRIAAALECRIADLIGYDLMEFIDEETIQAAKRELAPSETSTMGDLEKQAIARTGEMLKSSVEAQRRMADEMLASLKEREELLGEIDRLRRRINRLEHGSG